MEPGRDFGREPDFAEDRQPAQQPLNSLGRGTEDLLSQIVMEPFPRLGQQSHCSQALIPPGPPQHLHGAMHRCGPTTGVFPDCPRQAGRIPPHGLAQQCIDIGNVEGKVGRVDLRDKTTTPQPLNGEGELTSGYQDQMHPIRCLLAQTLDGTRRIALRLQSLQIIQDHNETLTQDTV
jgi:hypothetical protein